MRGSLAIIENMLVENLRNFLFSVDNLVDFMDEDTLGVQKY